MAWRSEERAAREGDCGRSIAGAVLGKTEQRGRRPRRVPWEKAPLCHGLPAFPGGWERLSQQGPPLQGLLSLASENVELILKSVNCQHGPEADQPDYDSVASDEEGDLETSSGKASRQKVGEDRRWQPVEGAGEAFSYGPGRRPLCPKSLGGLETEPPPLLPCILAGALLRSLERLS